MTPCKTWECLADIVGKIGLMMKWIYCKRVIAMEEHVLVNNSSAKSVSKVCRKLEL